MLRIPLDTVILTLKDMMGDAEKVTDVLNECIEPPNVGTIQRSYEVRHSRVLLSGMARFLILILNLAE